MHNIVDPDHFPKVLHLGCSSGTHGTSQGILDNNTYCEFSPVKRQFT